MNEQEKQFAIDLLKALESAWGYPDKSLEEYMSDLKGSCRKEIKKTINVLIKLGYKKC